MKKLLTGLLFVLPLTVMLGQEQNFNVTKISQFPLLTGPIPTNALFVIAIPGQANYAIYASPLANGLFQLQSNYTFLSNLVSSGFPTIESIATINPATQAAGSNGYWWDFNRTNSAGQRYIYQTLLATNPVVFLGATNCFYGGILSFDVVSSGGGYQQIYFPTNLPLFYTNGLYPSNSYYVLYLTNGNVFRMTLQSNLLLESQWVTKGQ